MKLSCLIIIAASVLLNLQVAHCQNETLTNNLISALFAFVEGNHEEMSAEMVEQLHAVQQGLESQAHALEDIEDEVDAIEDLALGSERCAGVIVSGHCVILHNQRYNIHTANDTCSGKEQVLAKIFTEHEYRVVMEYIRSSDVITDRSLVYVWTSMDVEGFREHEEDDGSPDNDDGPYFPAWLPSYPRRNPNFEYVAWQVVASPMFGDSGFMNVPAEATAYPLCAYPVDGDPGPETTTDFSSTTTDFSSTTTDVSSTTTTTTQSTTTVSTTTTGPEQCGEHLYGSFGALQSPNYPDNYDNMHNCEWQITVPADEVANFEISFISFHVESHGSCGYDALAIYDGPSRDSPLLGTFCGTSLPPTLHPTNPTVTVWFRTDSAIVRQGWLLSWTTQEDSGTTAIPSTLRPDTSTAPTNESNCSEALVGSSGTLQSPNYPANYDNNLNCETQITVPEGEIIFVNFETFDIEMCSGNDCTCDVLFVYDGPSTDSPLLDKFCGDAIPPMLTSTSNVITLHFVTDSSYTKLGWILSWSTEEPGTTVMPSTLRPDTSTATTNETRCGEDLYGSSGTLQSPNHPEVYDNDHDCEWQITVPADEVANFEITFIRFHVEHQDWCSYDSLSIYDGPSRDSPLLGRFCGTFLPPTLHPTNPTVTVWFKTDGSQVRSGWQLSWTTQEDSGTTAIPSTLRPDTSTTPTNETRQCGTRQQRSKRIKRAPLLVDAFDPDLKIVGGQNSAQGDWPWQIGYLRIQGSSYGQVCGGSLISTKWAITAAHCTYGVPLDGSTSMVRAGAYDLDANEAASRLYVVSQIINHEDYNDDTMANDISLLKLAGEAVFTTYIQPVCLPTQASQVPVGTTCWITGWGETQAVQTQIMQEATVPIIDNADCQSWSGLRIEDSMVCAGYKEGGIDSCQGDSGGPLVCESGSSFILQGVTSHGIGCAEPDRPGVYTRMSEFVTWTEETINSTPNEPGLFGLPMTECGTVITSNQNVRLPVDEETQLYGNNVECSWTVQPPAGTTETTFSFTGGRFHIEANTETTCFDYLDISKGGSRIVRLCGSVVPENVIVAGEGSITMNFHSDVSMAFEGFAVDIFFE